MSPFLSRNRPQPRQNQGTTGTPFRFSAKSSKKRFSNRGAKSVAVKGPIWRKRNGKRWKLVGSVKQSDGDILYNTYIHYISVIYIYIYQQTPGLCPESQDLPEVSPVICSKPCAGPLFGRLNALSVLESSGRAPLPGNSGPVVLTLWEWKKPENPEPS